MDEDGDVPANDAGIENALVAKRYRAVAPVKEKLPDLRRPIDGKSVVKPNKKRRCRLEQPHKVKRVAAEEHVRAVGEQCIPHLWTLVR